MSENKKYLSVIIPCYNSAEYMHVSIESALVGGEDVEILIVDDGSTKDNTYEIAKKYEEKYPTIIRAITQENKGHGGAVIQVLPMQPENISRFLTVMTGWMNTAFCIY